MSRRASRSVLLIILATVFTVGLTFASVELPYLVDEALRGSVQTPGFDSQADEVARLKTDLFISHYHLRAIGYVCFGALLLLIGVGFSTRRSGLAALGALAFMLPVFAQFAGVMFFLAGLGLLNVLWLPVLDVSFGASGLGEVVRAPYDVLRWVFGLLGINGYWPIVYVFIGSGLLLFFLGTLAWLSARSRKEGVAVSWVYRISRHPQYLGWIIWSYGVFLLLLQARYPRRSWGISATLPWLISAMVIIGVAMLEEVNMRRRHGEEYEAYRKSAPFLFPVPRFVERVFALPFRIFFKKDRPDRRREVAVVLVLYTGLLICASTLFYGDGWGRMASALRSQGAQEEYFSGIVSEIRGEPNWRRQSSLTHSLGSMGGSAIPSLLELLQDENPGLRTYAVETLRDFPSPKALEGLVKALEDSAEDVRWRAAEALGALGSLEAIDPLMPMLEDTVPHIRTTALDALARLGAEGAVPAAIEMVRSEEHWVRIRGVNALGTLGLEDGLPTVLACLNDTEADVRRNAVIALLRIGSAEAVPGLEGVVEDEDREVRTYAAEALKRLENR